MHCSYKVAVLWILCHLCLRAYGLANFRNMKIARDSPFSKKHLDDPIVHELLGGTSEISPYTGSGDTAYDALDLNCDFSHECCWNNANPPLDQLDWGLAKSDIDTKKAHTILQTEPPASPFLIAGSHATSSLAYADFISCTIPCQSGSGTLTFKHWSSPGVKFDVCTILVGHEEFADCQTIESANPTEFSGQIPESEHPFQIAIVASEFTVSPGGVAMIKDIAYSATFCHTDIETTTSFPIDQHTTFGACGVTCDFEHGDLCLMSNVPGSGAEWQARTNKTGNYAAGIPQPTENNKRYAGVALNPKQKAVLESPHVDVPEDAVLKFKYFESAYGVLLKACVDSPDNCPFTTPLDVSPQDRQWKDAEIHLEKGHHMIYFVGDNQKEEYAAVGIDEIVLTKHSGEPISC